MKPYSPMLIFSRKTLPPSFAALLQVPSISVTE